MKVIEADHERRYEMPGVPGFARKPVDIDTTKTEFTQLRSLRLYRFSKGGVVEGHAETDEVFLIVTSGSVELKITCEDDPVDAGSVYSLVAPQTEAAMPSVAYLPPHSAYELTPLTDADVLYARAEVEGTRKSAVFSYSKASSQIGGASTLLLEHTHAKKLGLQVLRVTPQRERVDLDVLRDVPAGSEVLIHFQSSGAQRLGTLTDINDISVGISPWQTAVVGPCDSAVMHAEPGTNAILYVLFSASNTIAS